MFVCNRLKMNKKRPGMAHFLKKDQTYLQWVIQQQLLQQQTRARWTSKGIFEANYCYLFGPADCLLSRSTFRLWNETSKYFLLTTFWLRETAPTAHAWPFNVKCSKGRKGENATKARCPTKSWSCCSDFGSKKMGSRLKFFGTSEQNFPQPFLMVLIGLNTKSG